MSDRPIIVADQVTVDLREGLNLVIYAQPHWTPFMAFAQAWSSSVLLKGKPVCFKGVLPGVTLHVTTQLDMHPGLIGFMQASWPHTLEQIQTWQQRAEREACIALSLPYSQAWIAQFDHVMPPAATHIEWRWDHCNPIQSSV